MYDITKWHISLSTTASLLFISLPLSVFLCLQSFAYSSAFLHCKLPLCQSVNKEKKSIKGHHQSPKETQIKGEKVQEQRFVDHVMCSQDYFLKVVGNVGRRFVSVRTVNDLQYVKIRNRRHVLVGHDLNRWLCRNWQDYTMLGAGTGHDLRRLLVGWCFKSGHFMCSCAQS